MEKKIDFFGLYFQLCISNVFLYADKRRSLLETDPTKTSAL